MLLYVGVPLLMFGLLMMARGWIYTLRPEGTMAQKRKRRNLKVGFTTDMAIFGRKVRRLGLLIALAGGGVLGWELSARVDAVAAGASADAGAEP
ncbi:MAG: hypothetical protein IT383_20850 [Deltaproteobacteria bacterium]|nr:hypothetical protein [Deltaproteobacteria bacterium]